MKVLIFGTMYLKNERDCKFVNAWYECWKRYNPEHDYLLIDSFSSEELIQKLNIEADRRLFQYDDIFTVHLAERQNVISFANNIGHLMLTGRDGWGRAFCTGIANAISNNYDYAVHIESDLLFKGNVSKTIRRMIEGAYRIVSTKSWTYGWLETGLMFMDVNFLREMGFISTYDWKNQKGDTYPELIIPQVVGLENIRLEYMVGDRNDYGVISDEDIKKCIYLTHCSDEQLRLFMES